MDHSTCVLLMQVPKWVNFMRIITSLRVIVREGGGVRGDRTTKNCKIHEAIDRSTGGFALRLICLSSRGGRRLLERRQRLCGATTTTRGMRISAFEGMSKRRRGYPSERAVKRGRRVVHGEKELMEKLGKDDIALAVPGGCFKRCCRNSGRYDGSLRGYYF
jgi:hypothetical protein